MPDNYSTFRIPNPLNLPDYSFNAPDVSQGTPISTPSVPSVDVPQQNVSMDTEMPSMDELEGIYNRKSEALAPLQNKMQSTLDEAGNLQMPAMKEYPKYNPIRMDKGAWIKLLSAMAIMGTIGLAGAKKNKLGAAMKALGGVALGYSKGRNDFANQQYQEYKTNFDAVQAENKAALQEYQNAYQKYANNYELLKLQMASIAQKYDDEATLWTLKEKRYDLVQKRIMDFQKMIDEAEYKDKDLAIKIFQAQEQAGNQTTAEFYADWFRKDPEGFEKFMKIYRPAQAGAGIPNLSVRERQPNWYDRIFGTGKEKATAQPSSTVAPNTGEQSGNDAKIQNLIDQYLGQGMSPDEIKQNLQQYKNIDLSKFRFTLPQ